ncbi:nitrate- and nitrite sensing domain-containing protein [Ramlibacter sp. AW1]|uniref:Nitrate- and nitrite sensing domain-containing protein n=1 Tax=Ramlibacter aurantiacus TaxID=2801330 RepID=A0A937D2L1_9BURK|nr:nitrate- and nitrite sensing domain-containing protein [Ramlibacter aurantiacus]
MTSASSFLLASRRCEIAELEQLARACEGVGVIGRFIHALQRERGMTNLLLGSGGRYGQSWREQVACCDRAQQDVLHTLEQLGTDPGALKNGSRLFNRVALVLHALDGLPEWRARIEAHAVEAADATAFFGKLIAALLAVVFEAADSAGDPEISRALIALLHLMQGKELAGQERALGARAFAVGHIAAADQQLWHHLIESQQANLQVLAELGDVAAAEGVRHEWPELERLRHLGCEGPAGARDSRLSNVWYEACTRRIDALKLAEDQLTLHLRRLCGRRIAQARGELADQREALDRLLSQAQPVDPATPAPGAGRSLDRAVLEMMQAQSHRLQQMADELEAVRGRLSERKLVERAKGLLMSHQGLSEEQAYRSLRQLAMNQNRRLADVAASVLALADVLPGGAR